MTISMWGEAGGGGGGGGGAATLCPTAKITSCWVCVEVLFQQHLIMHDHAQCSILL